MCFLRTHQIIKFDQNLCNVNLNDNNVLFLRVKSAVKTKDAMIEVPVTHNAILLKSGVYTDIVKAGRSKVFADLQQANEWKKGFTVDVIFVPKDIAIDIAWSTDAPVSYRDPKTKKIIGVAARGQLAATIENPTLFFRKIVGNADVFDRTDFSNRFKALINTEFEDAFLNVVHDEQIEYSEFDRSKKTIARKIESILNADFLEKYGVGISDFVIEQVGKFGIDAAEAEYEEEVAVDKALDSRHLQYEEHKEKKEDKAFERKMREKELDSKTAIGLAQASAGKADNDSIVYCSKCGTANPRTNTECSKCGTELAKIGLKIED